MDPRTRRGSTAPRESTLAWCMAELKAGWCRRLLCLAAVALLMASARAEGPTVDDLMKAKLNHAQAVLEGLVLEDFGAVARNAERLRLLSQEAGWQVLQTGEYQALSVDFRRATDALLRAAKAENIEAAGLAYVRLTMNCIECHQHVRDHRE